MSLRTQVQPYVLIGNLADLPNPASVPQAYLYHAADTGDCFILQIEPDTGLRHWVEFCGATGLTGIAGPALLKFAGGGVPTGGILIADDPGATSTSAGGLQIDYPVTRARTALNFCINLRTHTSGEIITVDFLVNGSAVLTHTFGATDANGTVFTVSGPANVPAGAKLNVRITSSGTSTVSVSATVELF